MEVSFAGHPEIGTVVALADLGDAGNMVLELGIGPMACTCGNGCASFNISAQLEMLAEPDPGLSPGRSGCSQGT